MNCILIDGCPALYCGGILYVILVSITTLEGVRKQSKKGVNKHSVWKIKRKYGCRFFFYFYRLFNGANKPF